MHAVLPLVFALSLAAMVVIVLPLVLLARSVEWNRRGAVLLGVCDRMARRLGVPVRGVRVLTAAVTLFTGIVPGLIAYVVAAVVLGRERAGQARAALRPEVLGLCADLARRLDVPVDNVRTVVVIATLCTGVVPGMMLYLLAGILKAMIPPARYDRWMRMVGGMSAWGAVPEAGHGAWSAQGDAAGGGEGIPARIGRYRILGLLGRGGMGSVWRGRDDALGRDAAVKVVDGPFGGEAVRRFGEEARAAAALASPHIVQVWEYAPEARPPYLAMEFVPGRSVQQIVRSAGPRSSSAVLDCARQVLTGLATAHAAGIVHRDIKPANILLATSGPAAGTYKLTDFGLATSPDRGQSLTATGTLLGTLAYLAPEVALGDEATPASDLYALGATLHEMLLGRPPLEAASPLKLLRRVTTESIPPIGTARPELSAAAAAWIDRLVARDPAERFPSAAAALEALEGVPEAGGAATGLDAAAGTWADAVPWHRRPAPGALPPRERVGEGDLPHVVGRAMAFEAEGRDALGEESILDIARELNIDTRAVREALVDHHRGADGVTAVFRRALGGAEPGDGGARDRGAFAEDGVGRRGPGLGGMLLAFGVLVGLVLAVLLVFVVFAARQVERSDAGHGEGGHSEMVMPDAGLRVVPPGVVVIDRTVPSAEREEADGAHDGHGPADGGGHDGAGGSPWQSIGMWAVISLLGAAIAAVPLRTGRRPGRWPRGRGRGARIHG